MTIKWVQDTRQYHHGYRANVGKWNVGAVCYDGMVSKCDPNKWCASCRLPGIKEILGWFDNEAEAREIVEKAVSHWFSHAAPTPPAPPA